MSTTVTRTSTRTDSTRNDRSPAARFAHAPVSAVAVTASLVGAAALFGYGELAHAVWGPMAAGDPGASQASPVTPVSFSIGVVTSMILGTILALALARWAKRPARTFLRSAIVLLGVSLVFPLLASHTDESTRLTLALAHLVAAAIIVPPITRRLAA